VRGLWIVPLLSAGCGRFGFDPPGGGDDVHWGDGGGNGDGSGTGDGNITGDAAVDALLSPNCGTTVLINDDFGDDAMGAQWTAVSSAGYMVAENAGRVAVTFPANASANTRAGYRQTASVSLTSICGIIELVQIPNASSTGYAYVRLGTPTLYVETFVQAGNIGARFDTGAQTGTIGGQQPFNATNHRFLRVRNTGGNSFTFDAGPSLTSFPTLIGSQGGAILNGISPSSLEIGAATETATSTAGSIAFESVVLLAP
jgi:hypothetical protein